MLDYFIEIADNITESENTKLNRMDNKLKEGAMETGQNILVAFDDSDNAMRALEHVAKFFNPSNRVTILSVLQDTATLFNTNHPELTSYFLEQQGGFEDLEEKHKSIVEEAQQKAVELLTKAGFKEENITSISQYKKKGIARDIIDKSAEGYDIIVMGRRGLSGIQEFLLGSVSQKVLHSVKNISVLIVN